MLLEVNDRQSNLILAALRLYMQNLDGNPIGPEEVEVIATNSDTEGPAPTAEEIDQLCRDVFDTF